MCITREAFDLLTLLERDGLQALPAEQDALRQKLTQQGLVDEDGLTADGYAALEPYRVRRAIFLAAGFGVRMVPVTLDMPKPLVSVNGRRIIETLLDAVVAAGIEEIWIVRGYKGEQFDRLLEKYPNICFVENRGFDKANNILSAYLVRDKLQNAYVFESDLYLNNPLLLPKYQYESNYLGVPTKHSDDWCFLADETGRITRLGIGGDDCFHMFGIGYMDAATGAKLETDIAKVYESIPQSHSHFWDDVALVYCPENYSIKVRKCSFDDVTEIDTLDELIAIDERYAKYKNA